MNKLQSKISKALKTNKLNPNKTGERKWYDYFLSIDGYLIHIYSDEYKTEHLASYTLTYNVFKNEDILKVEFEK